MNEIGIGLRGSLVDPSAGYLASLVSASAGTISLWILVATILVIFMQAGFLLLESGAARSKTPSMSVKNMWSI